MLIGRVIHWDPDRFFGVVMPDGQLRGLTLTGAMLVRSGAKTPNVDDVLTFSVAARADGRVEIDRIFEIRRRLGFSPFQVAVGPAAAPSSWRPGPFRA